MSIDDFVSRLNEEVTLRKKPILDTGYRRVEYKKLDSFDVPQGFDPYLARLMFFEGSDDIPNDYSKYVFDHLNDSNDNIVTINSDLGVFEYPDSDDEVAEMEASFLTVAQLNWKYRGKLNDPNITAYLFIGKPQNDALYEYSRDNRAWYLVAEGKGHA